MSLCELCSSIPLENLPPFPLENFDRNLSGYARIHHMFLKRQKREKDVPIKQFGIQYHADLDSLRKAASTGCELCQAIGQETDALIEEIATLPQPRLGLIPVEAIGSASDKDDPRPSGSSDRVIRELLDQAALDHVADWLEKFDEHPPCRNRGRSVLPTRLLGISATDCGSVIRLVEPDKDLCDPYITLSHCWGQGSKRFTTTSEAMPGRKEERESARMAVIYSNSYLTLAAVKSSDNGGGLLYARRPSTYLKLPCNGFDAGDKYILVSVLPLDKELIIEFHIEMKSEPLTKRAWGFQERVIARRILHFGSEQLYWECLEGFESEEGLRLPQRLPSVTSDPGIIEYVDGKARKDERVQKYMDWSASTVRAWRRLLILYGPRELTNPADKLPTISGVAETFSKIINDEYLAGLWRKSLIEGLCWQPLGCKAALGAYRAPSWSWASVDGAPATGFRGEVEPQAQVLDAKVIIDGDNPFGRLKDGWIKLGAPLVMMVLSENKGPLGHLRLRSEKGTDGCFTPLDTLDGKSEETEKLFRSPDLYALVLAFKYDNPLSPDPERKDGVAHALLVTPDEGRPGCMKRIGMVLQPLRSFETEELASAMSIVTLV
ncbi:hypothetical protein LZ30DRAFT_772400 [Colletotrichum cereale]|nr:hypothetical protein LZ30DRAFT_772400 [Colletotrichum cereale]